MKKRIAVVAVAAVLGLANAVSAGTIINFDDLADLVLVGNHYPGFLFTNFRTVTGYGETSPLELAYNTEPMAMVDVAGGFSSLSFTAGVFTPSTVSVYSGSGGTGALLGMLSVSNPPANPYAFAPETLLFSGVGRSVVVRSSIGSFGWDDVNFTTVPEPGTCALMLAGLALRGMIRRRGYPSRG